jgi:hypothetical protein
VNKLCLCSYLSEESEEPCCDLETPVYRCLMDDRVCLEPRMEKAILGQYWVGRCGEVLEEREVKR